MFLMFWMDRDLDVPFSFLAELKILAFSTRLVSEEVELLVFVTVHLQMLQIR